MAAIHQNILLTLLNLKGIGPSFISKNAQKILEAYNNNDNIESVLSSVSKKEFSTYEFEEAISGAASIKSVCEENNIKITTLYDCDYPAVLKNFNSKFPILYSLGEYKNAKTIGIIGSRKARPVSSVIATRIGDFCAQNKILILNGIAEGIDMKSIETDEAKRWAVGVMPGGLAFDTHKTVTQTYLNNAKIVLEGGGCLVSQFAPLVKQDQYKVAEYCKLQAALSDGLVLVQSSLSGGSRFTVEQFCQEEKTLFVVDTAKFDEVQEEYSANNLIIEKKQAGIAEWCNIKVEKVKSKIEIISSKEDYYKLLASSNTVMDNSTLF